METAFILIGCKLQWYSHDEAHILEPAHGILKHIAYTQKTQIKSVPADASSWSRGLNCGLHLHPYASNESSSKSSHLCRST